MDILIKDEISKRLLQPNDFDITLFEQIDSTNNFLKQLAKKGFTKNHIAVTEMQTGGKGRMGRSFYSPIGSGIYMSLLIKPPLPADMSVQITAATAVAVATAVEKFTDKEVQIKWVNDLLLENKKVCGILTEGSVNTNTNRFDWAVIGIGLNLYPPENDFPDDIKSIAGYVTEIKEKNLRNKLIAEIVNNVLEFLNSLKDKKHLAEYKKRSKVIGKQIKVIKNENVKNATALDIDDDCRLLVKYQDSKTEFLSFGEISIRF